MHNTPNDAGLMWFRRDLRLQDNTALAHALRACRSVHAVFVFDTDILDGLPHTDRRVAFIHHCVQELDQTLRTHGAAGAGLIVLHGAARSEIPRLAQALGVQAVFTNHDDEPAAVQRDAQVRGALADHGISLHSYKDHVVFERNELMTQSGTPYTVYTPYRNAWMARVAPEHLNGCDSQTLAHRLAARPTPWEQPPPSLAALGFDAHALEHLPYQPGETGAQAVLQDFLDRIDHYHAARDFPAVRGPSYLSPHLRFGTVSIRTLARIAWQLHLQGNRGAGTWLGELIWRDFYFAVLHHFPRVVSHCFKPAYDAIHWEHGPRADAAFQAWCDGRTGYPLVDAAMAQLNHTGYMHNRLRMVTASFLTKDLGIDWRRGEAYFARQLIDFDLAANNGGWQWAASTGCDAQPYFRIFNPVSQSQRFDPDGKFIRRYVPQLAGLPTAMLHQPWRASPLDLAAAGVVLGTTYPHPMVDHDLARQRTLERYAVVKAHRPA